MTPLREPQTLRVTPRNPDATVSGPRFCRRPGKGMAPRETRLLPAAAAHLPSSQGSCTVFLREGNIVVGHSGTWGSGSQPRRPACPAYAASPPPPRPPVRPVRPSGPAGCASEPQLIRFCCLEKRWRALTSHCLPGPAWMSQERELPPFTQAKGQQTSKRLAGTRRVLHVWDKVHVLLFPPRVKAGSIAPFLGSAQQSKHVCLEHRIQFRIQS